MSAPTITIRQVAGEELSYRVTVEPEPESVDMSGRFACHRAAYGFAAGLRMTHGGRILDLSADGGGRATALLGSESGHD